MRLFYVYSHRDEALRDQLETHLLLLKRQGFLDGWHDRRIAPGTEWMAELETQLAMSEMILLLVSADFLASDFCYTKELAHALERHRYGTARVVPVILRECDWENAPFAKLQALPKDGHPITSWENRDAAWTNVARGVRAVVEELGEVPSGPAEPSAQAASGPSAADAAMVEIRNFGHRVTERNNVWWRVSWTVTLASSYSEPVSAQVHIDFMDGEGYLLERAVKDVSLQPRQVLDVREFSLIRSGSAENICHATPSIVAVNGG